MQSIHFICRREGASFHGLSLVDRELNKFRSCCWDMSEEDARRLIGGWIYLHQSKERPSSFGGLIAGYELVELQEKGHPNRIAFLL